MSARQEVSMFGIGLPELILILLVALIVVGPSRLPELAKGLGKGLREFRKATEEIKHSLADDETFQDLEEIKHNVRETVEAMKSELSEDLSPAIEPIKPALNTEGRKQLMEKLLAEPDESQPEDHDNRPSPASDSEAKAEPAKDND